MQSSAVKICKQEGKDAQEEQQKGTHKCEALWRGAEKEGGPQALSDVFWSPLVPKDWK